MHTGREREGVEGSDECVRVCVCLPGCSWGSWRSVAWLVSEWASRPPRSLADACASVCQRHTPRKCSTRLGIDLLWRILFYLLIYPRLMSRNLPFLFNVMESQVGREFTKVTHQGNGWQGWELIFSDIFCFIYQYTLDSCLVIFHFYLS